MVTTYKRYVHSLGWSQHSYPCTCLLQSESEPLGRNDMVSSYNAEANQHASIKAALEGLNMVHMF